MLHNARRLLEDLGMTVEVNRSEWSLARLLLVNGEFDKAISMLTRVRDFFLEKGMPEEAGLAGLDLADGWIATDHIDRARELVETIRIEFSSANLSERALTAFSYLRDVLRTTKQPQRAVRHVREYLKQLRTELARLFLPFSEE